MRAIPALTDKAPMPIGPYSQSVWCGDLLFISGQLPLDPVNGAVCGTTVEAQAQRVLDNLLAILNAQDIGIHALVKTTVFLRDMRSFAVFNTVYESKLGGACPARSVVEVSGLPKDVLVEIEAVACR